jgi:hypothetical protein
MAPESWVPRSLRMHRLVYPGAEIGFVPNVARSKRVTLRFDGLGKIPPLSEDIQATKSAAKLDYTF